MITAIRNFLFKNQSLRQTIAKNTFWLFIGQVLGRAFRAVIIIYAARILGAAGYGVFSYAISIAALFTIFTDLGVNAIITRETAKLQSHQQALASKDQVISTSFFIKLAMTVASLFIFIVIVPLLATVKEAIPLFPVIAFILIFDSLREFGFSITRALERMEIEAWLYILTNIIIVLASFFFLWFKPTPLYLAYGYVTGTGIGVLATLFVLRHHFRKLWQNFMGKLVKPIIALAWPFAMLGIMGGLMINTDTILLGWLRTVEELGFYAAAQKPVQVLYVLPTLLATSLFPTLARLANTQQEKMAEIVKKSAKLLLMAALPMAFVGVVLGAEIISLVFGESYLQTTLSWQILIVTLVVIFPGTIIGNTIFAYDKQNIFIKTLVIGAVSNIILDLLFIPRWGGPGSAAATLLVQIFINAFLWYHLKKINPLITVPGLYNIIGASALMVVTLLLLRWLGVYFILNAIVASLIYIGFFFMVKDPILKILWTKF